jgi:hypothetical protein
MLSKIDTGLINAINQFTPEILGVFWITNEELSGELVGLDVFNYLFDGLITQYLFDKTNSLSDKHLERLNVFYTKNFNETLFLAHLKINNEMSGFLDEQIALIQNNKNGDRKKILIFNQTQKNWSSDLQKRYPQFEFSNLEF